MTHFDIAIIGGGILGTSLSYFLSHLGKSKKIAVIEQENKVGYHASSRNTGKVHAPYLYNPQTKKLFAKMAFHGYQMWEEYAKAKKLPFEKDGVIQVALQQKDILVLKKYHKWGLQNGLNDDEITLLDKEQVKKIEPNIQCESALYVKRDASVDYSQFTHSLMNDSKKNNTTFVFNSRVTALEKNDQWTLTLDNKDTITAKFIINAAGGESIDIAHHANVADNFTDVHFRGEYWQVPDMYEHLTKSSVYSVPEFPDYPFLDPHWIVRADKTCEIGPNAVPVFGPYGYNNIQNIKEFIPKMLEMLSTGARKAIFDKQFQKLALEEIHSSISKSAMINRVKRFLPEIDESKIVKKGTAGIRSSVIDEHGKFVSDAILIENQMSCHILNYNSPGATGVLAFSAHVLNQLFKKGFLECDDSNARCGPWQFQDIIDRLD